MELRTIDNGWHVKKEDEREGEDARSTATRCDACSHLSFSFLLMEKISEFGIDSHDSAVSSLCNCVKCRTLLTHLLTKKIAHNLSLMINVVGASVPYISMSLGLGSMTVRQNANTYNVF